MTHQMAYILRPALLNQIRQLESRIEELRLVEIPDVESIRNLQANLDDMRKTLSDLDDIEVPFAPV